MYTVYTCLLEVLSLTFLPTYSKIFTIFFSKFFESTTGKEKHKKKHKDKKHKRKRKSTSSSESEPTEVEERAGSSSNRRKIKREEEPVDQRSFKRGSYTTERGVRGRSRSRSVDRNRSKTDRIDHYRRRSPEKHQVSGSSRHYRR